jgi:hypothetical protein
MAGMKATVVLAALVALAPLGVVAGELTAAEREQRCDELRLTATYVQQEMSLAERDGYPESPGFAAGVIKGSRAALEQNAKRQAEVGCAPVAPVAAVK